MSTMDTDERIWLIPWRPFKGEGDATARELYSEVGEKHILHGIKVRAVAHRQDRGDALFELLDGSGRFAVVHLTFAQHPERNPCWPRTEIYPDFSQFEARRMRRDAEEFGP